MDSSDVIEDSFNETGPDNFLNNLSDVSTDKQASTDVRDSVEEVDDSLLSNPRLSDEMKQKTPEKSSFRKSTPKKSTAVLNDSDNFIPVSTKKNRRRILSDSEDEAPNKSMNESYREPPSISDDSENEASNKNETGSTSENSEYEAPNKSVNETYREISSTSEDSENDEEIPVIISDDDETPLQEINLNEMKTKLSTSMRQPTLQSMVQNLTIKKEMHETDGKYYCTAAEYSNQATKVANLRTDSLKCKNALRTVNLDSLPDKGALLKKRQFTLEQQLEIEDKKLKNMVLDTKAPQEEKKISWNQLVENSNCVVPKTFGKQAMNTYSTQKTLTMERLKSLHDSLATCPDENTLAEDPKGLKIELMPHQKRALAWLVWREGQRPPGGILADDMGLGKTLTMISLIVQTKELQMEDISEESENEPPKDDKWLSRKSKLRPQGGTLVICPATLIGQWEGEIERRIKRNLLTVELYHGSRRETKTTRLAKYDVVITTYKLVQGEYEKRGTLFNIKWKRIILDEAHVVRNHKSQTSIAACGLTAKTRWALTGTPVHNKELDLFALLKFLRCSPFDDLVVWKQWVANKNAGGQDRLNTVMTSILLRRTKAQLQSEGALQSLPEKKFEEIYVELDDDEKKVYQKVLLFSRNLFIEFLRQREAKNPYAIYMRGGAPEPSDKADDEQYHKMHRKMLEMYGSSNIKSHQILVLLLRLRQICCHPSLIHAILDDENCQTEGIEENGVDIDIFDKFANMNLDDDAEQQAGVPGVQAEAEDFNAAANKILSAQNPVFHKERPNEKLRIIQKIIEDRVIPNDDKIIIVSQWTTMLQIIYKHLKQSKIKCELLDGSVPVAKRNDLVNCFNDARQPIKVLLLSLTAGGVGLNLVGANHLLLVDLHWNPQLESQAQDRIYRVGQKKTVHVYKIITKETIEQRIKALQDSKLSMASDILAGTRAAAASKLSLDDLKMLFNIGPQIPTNTNI